jgi:hypothetical protein
MKSFGVCMAASCQVTNLKNQDFLLTFVKSLFQQVNPGCQELAIIIVSDI